MLNLSIYVNLLVGACCGTLQLHSAVNEAYFALFSVGAIRGGVQPNVAYDFM